jgi:hypothetical protein
MELSLTAMLYGSLPWMDIQPKRLRRSGKNPGRRFFNDYD